MEEAAALGDGDAVLDESERMETVSGPPLSTKISPLAGSLATPLHILLKHSRELDCTINLEYYVVYRKY
jgi:hypothetical protein